MHVIDHWKACIWDKRALGGSASQVVSSRAASNGMEQSKGQPFRLKMVPMALTCSMYGSCLIADPTSEEEALAASLVSTVVDAHGRLLGAYP